MFLKRLTKRTLREIMFSLILAQWHLRDYYLGWSIRNINYTKFKTKENLNILTLQQKKQKPKYISFYICFLWYFIFCIINPTSYISFNVHDQTIIHPLNSHLIDLFQIFLDLNELFLKFKINKFLLLLLGLLIFIFKNLDQISLLLGFF